MKNEGYEGGDVFLQEPHNSKTLQNSGANMPNTSHNTRHLEGCTSQGTSKDAHHSTSKDAHIKETRRIRNKSHYKGNHESHTQTNGQNMLQ